MKSWMTLAVCLLCAKASAATSCLAFMKDSVGGSVANIPRQIITEPEKLLWSYDGISVTVNPATADFSNIAVTINNDGRRELLVGETVWLSGEYLSKSNEAYWILIDCAPEK